MPSTRIHEPGAAGLLVVTVDRLPAWMLSAYGSTWVATPSIDALAARGVVFDRVITPSAEPCQTLAELAACGDCDAPSIWEAATHRGWKTAFVTDDAAAVACCRADRGSVEVVCVPAEGKSHEADDEETTELSRLFAAASRLMLGGQHRLVWCHVTSLGVTWDAPRRYREQYVDPEDPAPPAGADVPSFAVDSDTDPDRVVGIRQVFAGQLSLLDSLVGRLTADVRYGSGAALGAESWALLFAGVRGLPLGLHGWVGVGGPSRGFGESVHVPAVLVDAAGRMAAQRHDGLVVPGDIGCTLATMIAGEQRVRDRTDPATPPWCGVSLERLFEDWSTTPRDRVVVDGGLGMAVVTPAWHCLTAGGSGRLQLFAKPDDYFELADVADRCGIVAERLADLMARAEAGDRRILWRETLPGDLPS